MNLTRWLKFFNQLVKINYLVVKIILPGKSEVKVNITSGKSLFTNWLKLI